MLEVVASIAYKNIKYYENTPYTLHEIC